MSDTSLVTTGIRKSRSQENLGNHSQKTGLSKNGTTLTVKLDNLAYIQREQEEAIIPILDEALSNISSDFSEQMGKVFTGDSSTRGLAETIKAHFPRDKILKVLCSTSRTATLPAYLAGSLRASQEALVAAEEKEKQIQFLAMQATLLKAKIDNLEKRDEEKDTLLKEQSKILSFLEGKVETQDSNHRDLLKLTFTGQFLNLFDGVTGRAKNYLEKLDIPPSTLLVILVSTAMFKQSCNYGKQFQRLRPIIYSTIPMIKEPMNLTTRASATLVTFKILKIASDKDFNIKREKFIEETIEFLKRLLDTILKALNLN
jgi:hypothetical protein